MKNMRKNRFIGALLIFAMIFSIFINAGVAYAYASPVRKASILPDFIETSIAIMYQGASSAKIAEIRAEWAEQIAFNQKSATQTDSTVSSQSLSIAYMSTYLRSEDLWGGVTYNPSNVAGTADFNYARFYTPSLNQAAQVVGQLSSPMNGRVNILAKLGPTGAGHTGNYLVVWGSETGADWTWHSIGYAQVTQPYSSPYAVYYYVGTTMTVYSYVTVSAVTTMGPMDVYNDVLADAVYYNFPIY